MDNECLVSTFYTANTGRIFGFWGDIPRSKSCMNPWTSSVYSIILKSIQTDRCSGRDRMGKFDPKVKVVVNKMARVVMAYVL